MKKSRLIKIFTFMICSFIGIANVFASSVSMKTSSTTITRGNTVTITTTVNADSGIYTIEGSMSCKGSGVNGGVDLNYEDMNTSSKSKSFTYTIKPTSSGTVTCTTSNVNIRELAKESNYQLSNATITIQVKDPAVIPPKEYSSDNTLESLSIEGYDLTPKFNKDTTEYKLAVDESVEKIKINAKANHEKASVTGTGETNLTSGENTIQVKVTAENGNEKIYKIIVTVEDQNPIKAKVDKEEFTIVKKNNNLIEKPEHYEETTIQIDDQDVIAYKNSKTKVTLVLLKDKNNKIEYYIYNEQTNEYIKYNYIKVQNITLQLLDPIEKLKNYKSYKINIGEKEVNIYKIKKTHKVGLIYGTNIATGNTDYYVYDEKEGTLGIYYDEELKIYEQNIDKIKKYSMIIIGFLSLVTIIAIVTSLLHGKKRKKKIKA